MYIYRIEWKTESEFGQESIHRIFFVHAEHAYEYKRLILHDDNSIIVERLYVRTFAIDCY